MDLLDWLKPFVLALGLSLGSLCHIYGLTQKIGQNQPKIHDFFNFIFFFKNQLQMHNELIISEKNHIQTKSSPYNKPKLDFLDFWIFALFKSSVFGHTLITCLMVFGRSLTSLLGTQQNIISDFKTHTHLFHSNVKSRTN